MGLTHVRARVANPARPTGDRRHPVPRRFRRRIFGRACIDAQSPWYSPHSSRTFLLADGTEITRPISDATFVVDGERAASPVIFGEQDDAALLGPVFLGSLGLILDPMKRILRPLPMVLGLMRPTRR